MCERRLALSVARAFLGLAVLLTPMPSVLARDKMPRTDIEIIVYTNHPVYPLKASANNRFLVYQINTPFLMVGDFPQQLITNLSQKEAAAFMENRQKYGINALWINLLCISTDPSCNRETQRLLMEWHHFVYRAMFQPQMLRISSASTICSPSRRTTAWLFFWIR